MYLDRIFWHFVLYYIYGSVRAIPTYRVYRLYDIVTNTTPWNDVLPHKQLMLFLACLTALGTQSQPSKYMYID